MRFTEWVCGICEPLGKVMHKRKQETVYLPMDCPNCGRQRLEWDGYHVVCEKCHVADWQHPSRREPLRYEVQEEALERLAAPPAGEPREEGEG